MARKYSMLLLALFIIGLYLLLNKGVLPFVTKVAESDLFFEKNAEPDELLGKVRTERTDHALTHCKAAVRDSEGLGDDAVFQDGDYEAWALGNRTYVIKAVVTAGEKDGRKQHQFACKIKYNGEDAAVAANWTILGVDYNAAD